MSRGWGGGEIYSLFKKCKAEIVIHLNTDTSFIRTVSMVPLVSISTEFDVLDFHSLPAKFHQHSSGTFLMFTLKKFAKP